MSDLKQRLARLGLSQYVDVLTAEGFDTWETILDITESDLSSLNVKLGHRRKLQRAIVESRGKAHDVPLPIALQSATSTEGLNPSGDESTVEGTGNQEETLATGTAATGTATKRKYRRHPKPDEHAPERPPSAYVIFSNHTRELLKGQELSFTDIAKVVGERWQVLPSEEREGCERQANGAKERYYAELAEYKKTPHYDAYQKYLEDFRAKHGVPTKEGKRSKIEVGSHTSVRNSYHNGLDHESNRGFRSMQSETSTGGRRSSETSPATGSASLPIGVPYSTSKSTSPTSLPLSTLNSPNMGTQYSPISASPRISMYESTSSRDMRGFQDMNVSNNPSAFVSQPHQTSSTTPPLYPLVPRFQSTQEILPRRSMRENIRLPPLTHEDTTLSSESGHSSSGYNFVSAGYSGAVLSLDGTKIMRTLPQPVPSLGPSSSPLDRSLGPVPQPHPSVQHSDYRTQGSLAALVRAGELVARIAEDESTNTEGLS